MQLLHGEGNIFMSMDLDEFSKQKFFQEVLVDESSLHKDNTLPNRVFLKVLGKKIKTKQILALQPVGELLYLMQITMITVIFLFFSRALNTRL